MLYFGVMSVKVSLTLSPFICLITDTTDINQNRNYPIQTCFVDYIPIKKTNEVIFIAHVFLLVYFFLLVTSHCRCYKYKILFPELPLGGCLNLPPQIPTLIFLNTWYFIVFDLLLVEVHCTWLADCLVTCVLYWLHTASRYIVEKRYCWKRSKIEGKLSSIIGIYS